jgi:hypothetical protein
MTNKQHYEKAIEYVRENKSWSETCEQYALEIIGQFRYPIEQASDEIDSEITELMNDYGRMNNLPEDWWYEFGDTDDVFFKL